MAPQPDTVLLACEHKFHCIVGGETFSYALDAILKAHADSQCPCTLAGCDRAWISVTGPNDALPADAETVAMDDVVDMYEPPMVWFGSAWDEPTDYALVNPHCKMNSSVSSGSRSSSYTFMPREAFIVVRPGLLRCGIDPNMPMRLPPSKVSYTNASRLNGVVWIDKTGAMDDMDRLGAPLSLIRRPSGFGKTCFALMNLYYHSALTDSDMFSDMFSATKIMSSPLNFPNSSGRLILFFDLAKVSNGPVEHFKGLLQMHVQSSIITFMGQYGELLESHPNAEAVLPGSLKKNGFLCIEGIRHLIGASGWTVYVFIDNYNAPARAYNNSTRIASLIDLILVRPLRDLGGLVADGLILGECMEGDDGDYCDDEDIWLAPSPWNQISEDYTRHSYVDAAFGLSVDEIAWLCKAVSPEDRLLLGKILQDVRGYQFGPDVGLKYGTRDVIDAIRAHTEGGEAVAILK
ncbi:hypothetical protein BDZ89DRAFT_1066924 [Hymenopellis radicata]|nr:hypothetical protein BDZ89DRAFT_1066924 [Hymenopellis radicata]